MLKIRNLIAGAAVVVFLIASPAFADMEKIDQLLDEFDSIMPKEPVVMTLDECIEIAIENNHELRMKLAIMNSVDGDQMIDRSRFHSHVDFIGDFARSQGSLLKTYYPTHNPYTVSSLGTLDTSSLSVSSGSSGSSSGLDLSSLGGIDISQVSSLAAQYGIDISQYLQRTAAPSSPAEERAAERAAQQVIPGTNIDLDEINELMENIEELNDLFDSSSSTSDRTSAHTQVAMRYSRRLLEWGKDSSSSVQIRANRRLAIYNYQQKLREVISEVRTTFFTILLKKQQIETREKLLAEYEKKQWQQQKRFEVARDVPRIDVLTAELDVLNEKNRINALHADLIEEKYDLLQLINMPLDTNVDFGGVLPEFDYSLRKVVKITKENSFNITYLEEEFKEDQREFEELAWDYKPIFSAKVGVENRRSSVSMAINNSNQTYGLDLGGQQYLNLPTSTSVGSFSSDRADHNYSLSAGVVWNLFDNTQRKGVRKKHIEKLNETRIDLDRQIELEELNARKAYNNLKEAEERLAIQEQIVEIAQRRLDITRKLREYGKVAEYQLDTYRDNFFSQQDRYFSEQENLIVAQENLRRVMGLFE